MRLWRMASGKLKDKNSIWIASLTRRTALRNPDIEAAVIKATSHDDSRVDYRNAQRVFAWVRMSPDYLKPLVWSISYRMERTRSWAVALKGLMLIHGVFCCKVPSVQRIGRLPFDLSNFTDAHSRPEKTFLHNAFIRDYYAFLNHKSSFLFLYSQDRKGKVKLPGDHQQQHSMIQEIILLQKLQGLLDMLLKIKPESREMIKVLILEAMDCIVVEIFDVYSRICNGIARVLTRIDSAAKVEAAMALRVLQKSTTQGEELSLYLKFCRDIGVINASECPKLEQIPEEDIRDLENVINGVSDTNYSVPRKVYERKDSMSSMQTVITDEWEVFDESPRKLENGENRSSGAGMIKAREDSFAVNPQPLHVHCKSEDLPDLINFL